MATKKRDYIRWDESKKIFLEEIYSVTSNKELAEMFSTTVKGIESQAVRQNLKKLPETISKNMSHPTKNGRKQILIHADGNIYIYMPGHPFCNYYGYVLKHKLVMEEDLKRYLDKNEIVIHKNGDKGNNDLENLELKIRDRPDVNPIDVFNDRNNGMTIKEIRLKYDISIRTFYSKFIKGEEEYAIYGTNTGKR